MAVWFLKMGSNKSAATKQKELIQRVLSAAVAVPILLFTIWSPLPYFFVALAVVAVLIALNEFYNLAAKVGCNAHKGLGYLAGAGTLACFVFNRLELVGAVMAALVIFSFSMQLAKPDELKTALVSVAATVLGVVYVALLAGFLVGVRMIEDTSRTNQLAPKLLTTFFALVIFTDTGAYFAGRTLGSHGRNKPMGATSLRRASALVKPLKDLSAGWLPQLPSAQLASTFSFLNSISFML
jgi:phosphatidate cytidylyltransferase